MPFYFKLYSERLGMEFWLFLNTFLLIKGNFTLSEQKDPLGSPKIISNLFHQSKYEVHVQNFDTGIINILSSFFPQCIHLVVLCVQLSFLLLYWCLVSSCRSFNKIQNLKKDLALKQAPCPLPLPSPWQICWTSFSKVWVYSTARQ